MAGLFSPGAMTAYQPTLRDKAAMGILSLLGNPSSNSTAGQIVGGLLGSLGAGQMHNNIAGGNGLIDLTPLGMPFMADEAGRQMASGHPIAGAANLAMALPLPAGKLVSGVARAVSRAPERNLVAEAAERALAQRQVADAARLAAQKQQAAAPIIAYHGSPHAFDKFDTAKIGTGEGAQAYGHGLYFAENEKTAKAYRNQLSGYLVNGRDPNDGEAYAIQALDAAGGDPKRALAMHEAAKGQYPGWNSPEGQKTLEQWAEQGAPAITSPGHTYQVGINAHPDHFLDWDKPLIEQPAAYEKLKTAEGLWGRLPWNDAAVGYPTPGTTGEEALRPVFDTKGKEAVARHLSEAGIPGIRYLDQGSRLAGDAGDGTRNYVVFNPEHIDILKRYGIPATVMGGAGAAAYGAQQQQPDGGL